ncbi:MAG: hypothetical protein V3U75_13340 [Methylococcaceae bacterium]
MIKDFNIEDLEKFTPNSISRIDEVRGVLEDPSYDQYTLWRGGIVKAVLCFRNNGNGDWLGFLLIAKDFAARDGIRARRFIRSEMAKHRPKRVWTVSSREPFIAKWHEFLGMKIESPIIVEGRQCDVWSMKWE